MSRTNEVSNPCDQCCSRIRALYVRVGGGGGGGGVRVTVHDRLRKEFGIELMSKKAETIGVAKIVFALPS